MLFVLALSGVEPKLDVITESTSEIIHAGKKIKLNGEIRKLADGSSAMSYGEKVYSFPSDKLFGDQGTLILDFAIDELKKSGNAARPLVTIRGRERTQIGIATYYNNPVVQFRFTDFKHSFIFGTLEKLIPGRIYQAALTWDGEKVRCWLDGKLVKESEQPLKISLGSLNNLHLGPYKDGFYITQPWPNDTMVKRLRAYDKALSGKDIAALSGVKVNKMSERYPRVLSVPKRSGKIVADGELEDAGWRNAASVIGLIDFRNPEKSWELPAHHVYFTWDERNLYISFDSVFPVGSTIQKGTGPKDKESGVWSVESFELHLRHGGNTYYFGGNVAGGKADMRNHDANYNPSWNYVSTLSHRVDDTQLWRGEAVIPWSALELSGPPAELKMNFCRTWCSSKVSAASDLANQKENGYWADNEYFTLLKMVEHGPTLRTVERGNPSYGELAQKFELYSPMDSSVELKIIQENSAGMIQPREVYSQDFRLKAGIPHPVSIRTALTTDQADRLVYELSDVSGKRVAFRQEQPLKISVDYLAPAFRFTSEKILLNVKTAIITEKFGTDFVGRIVLTGPDGRHILSVPVSGKQPQKLPFKRDNPAGIYRLELLNTKTGKAISGNSFNFPGFGDWAKMTFDRTRIIPPYTPLETLRAGGKLTVKPCGRAYTWSDGHGFLPSGIVSRGRELLSSPAELLVNGVAVKTGLTPGKSEPHRVEFSSCGATADCRVSSRSWLEYDGLQYNRAEFTALKDLTGVELRFTLPRKEVKYLHTSTSQWDNKLTMAVPDGKFEFKYYPVVFLGDETGGLCFFAESRVDWPNRNENPLRLFSDGEKTVFSVRLAEKMKAGETFSFEFGLLGAPVKPLPKNYPLNTAGWGYSIPLNRPGRRPTTWCSYLSGATSTLSDAFADLPSSSNNPVAQKLREVAAEARRFGTKPFTYNLANFLTDEYPETLAFLDEWRLIPDQVWPGKRGNRDYTLFGICPASAGADFYLYKLKDYLQRVPLDGINLDFGLVPVCDNHLHGCRERTPLLAYRDFLRKIALCLLDSGVKDYIIHVHNTNSVQLPCYTFVTHMVNGEHIRQQSSNLMHNGKDILDTYKLPMFACELSSLPFGVTNSVYQSNDVLTAENGGGAEDPELYKLRITRAFLAGTLVHNTILSMHRCHHGIFDKLVRIYDEFGAPESEFIGYWDARCPIRVISGKDVYASVFRNKRTNRLLAVISHLGNERLTQDVTLTLDSSVLGMPKFKFATEHIDAPDAEYEELYKRREKYGIPASRAPLKWIPAGVKVLDFNGETLSLHLPYHSFALVELF